MTGEWQIRATPEYWWIDTPTGERMKASIDSLAGAAIEGAIELLIDSGRASGAKFFKRCVCLDSPGKDGLGRRCKYCDGSGWNQQ